MATRRRNQRTTGAALQPRLSVTGLNLWGGRILEEYLPELRGKTGIATYNEMRKNNSIIGGFLRAVEMAFRSVTWSDIPYEESPEAMRRAAFLTSVRNDMEDTWTDFMTNVTTVLPFGHAPFEKTYKIRDGRPNSLFKDNKVGIRNLDLIPQDTIERWESAPDTAEVTGLTQRAPPTYKEIFIPMEKIVNFRMRLEKQNPEGESLLRTAYRDWYFVNNLEAIEGISLERTGAGIPLIKLPKGATTIKDKGNLSDEQAAINIVKQVRVDEQGGIVLFDGWEFILARPEGRVDPDLFDLAIKRHRSNMLISVLAAFLEFGTARVGSFALAEQSRNFFEVALEGYVAIAEETFNRRVVPELFELNGIEDGMYPKLTHTTVGDPQLQIIANYITQLTSTGHLSPDPVLSEYLRDLARFPKGATIAERQRIRTHTDERNETNSSETEIDTKTDTIDRSAADNFNRGSLNGNSDIDRQELRRMARVMADKDGD